MRCAFIAFLAAVLAGCVTVENEKGLVPPPGLCAFVKGTVGMPKGPVNMRPAKTYTIKGAFQLNDWVFSGLSAGYMDLAVAAAAKEGGLVHVDYADWSLTSIFGFINCLDLTVYGQ